jgi:hypothetical protein
MAVLTPVMKTTLVLGNFVLYFRYFSCILKFAIGNDKGEVSLYDVTTGSYSYKLHTAHEGSVIGVEYDQSNKLFVTIGLDSTILIHK